MTTEKPQEPTLGKLIDLMLEIRTQRSELSKQDKALKEQFDALELSVIQKLRDQDTLQGRSSSATATISETVIATIEDWNAFESYIKENDALYLLGKSPSNAAYRELLQQGEEIPGLKPFTKTSISLRRL